MSDEIEAVTETAKLGQAVIEAGSDLAKYVGRALGTVPEDLIGLGFGDRLRVKAVGIARARARGMTGEL